MAASWERNWIDLPKGYFATSLVTCRLDYAFTPLLTIASYAQYDTDSRDIGLQSRLRWILRPGNEFLVVINHSWREDVLGRFEPAQTRFRAKLNWLLRF